MAKKKKKLKVQFAATTAVDALQPYVDALLECLGAALKRDLKSAFISDMSTISCFLESEDTGKTASHPLDADKQIKVVTGNTVNNRRLMRAVSTALGIKVGIYDHIYEVAIRLRDKA